VLKQVAFCVALLVPTALPAQSSQSAIGGDGTIWAGAAASVFSPDFGCSHDMVFACSHDVIGPAVFFNVNLTSRISSEGEARWMEWNGLSGEKESNYLIGPRYRLYRHDRYSLWLKAMFGGGWITTSGYPQQGSLKGSYLAYAPGGTLEYRLSRHWNLRADYEYQFWPSFGGPTTYKNGVAVVHDHGISPNGFTVGAAWRFW
jgi:hypothetical protein